MLDLIERLKAGRLRVLATYDCTDAAAEIERLRKIEVAARDFAVTLRGGFIVCQRCGGQETTADMDGAQELYAALGI